MDPVVAPWRVLETTEPGPVPEPQPAPRGLPWPAIAVALVAGAVAAAALLVTAQGDPVIGVDGAAAMDAGSAEQGGAWSTEPAPRALEVVVDVGGAVLRPGVYRLPAGSRVGDAIGAAGGYSPSVDAALADAQLNLAAPVSDGEQVRVPVRGETVSGTAAGDGAGRAPGGGLVDLNTASAEALDTLPGVGPATAAKIIAAREEQPFATVDELLVRKVLGAATLEKLRPLVTTGP